MTAFGGFFQKCIFKREQLSKVAVSHYVHNLFIVFGTCGVITVRAASCKFVGQVAAGDPGNLTAQLFCCFRNEHANPVMLFQGKTGEGQPYDFAGFAVPGKEIQGHHGSVIQFRLPVAQGAGGDARLFCRSINRANQLFVIDNAKLNLGRAELGHRSFCRGTW